MRSSTSTACPSTAARNTVTGAIPGVTLSLGSADPGYPGADQRAARPTQASQAIQDFVDAYNAVMGRSTASTRSSSSGNEGVLAGDSMLRSLQSSLLSMVATR